MGPLEGIKVIEMANGIHGPYASMLLADMGADVIKIEPPFGDMNRVAAIVEGKYSGGSQFYACNRNKRAMCVDLTRPEGVALVRELLEDTDVLLENMRPGVLDRRGLGYDTLKAELPQLIYASATGYGPIGPRANLASLDIVGQAAGGVVAHTGTEESGPLPAGAALADHGGALWLAYGIMAALYARERTGRGQRVQTSLLGSQIGLQAWEMSHYMLTNQESGRGGTGHPLARGGWRIFAAKDGHFALAGVTDERWQGLCQALGVPGLASDPRFDSAMGRLENGDELLAAIEPLFQSRPVRDLVRALEETDQIVAMVMNYADLCEDEQTRLNGYVTTLHTDEYGDLPMVGLPVSLSETPASIRSRPPDLDANTVEILHGLGRTDEQVAAMYTARIVGPNT
ncbi:MAG: CoA transferase [Dehalococcoidia bacterium]|nr:CoA transferase [Dehalococcoidia bacterium]